MGDRSNSRLRTTGRILWRITRFILFASFAIVSALGLVRAWTVPGNVENRRAELQRLEEQLIEQQARGAWLQSHLAAFRTRSDVRMHTIRTELGMLRDNEQFYVFK